jgi:addiction module RelE/StbE family toxin
MEIRKSIKIVWDLEAKDDLKNIFNYYKLVSIKVAKKLVNDIVTHTKEICFVEQYQTDEYLGEPFRRMIISHYKIVYKVHSETEIRVLQIFDTRQNQKKLRNTK